MVNIRGVRSHAAATFRWLAAGLLAVALAASPAIAAPQDGSSGGTLSAELVELLDADWPSALPPVPTPTSVQPRPVANCENPGVACADDRIAAISALLERLGCDHRAVWVTSALTVWKQVKKTLETNPDAFEDPAWSIFVTTEGANLWMQMYEDHERGRAVPRAWEIAFDAAANRDITAGQNLLLGINGHMQLDVPYALEEQGLRWPDGRTRKPDWERFHAAFRDAYDSIVEQIGRRFDPAMQTLTPGWHPFDNVFALQLIRVWREGTWRNAERLLNARTEAEREQVSRDIDTNAAVWAEAIARHEIPGYRERRDAYCESGGASREQIRLLNMR